MVSKSDDAKKTRTQLAWTPKLTQSVEIHLLADVSATATTTVPTRTMVIQLTRTSSFIWIANAS